MRSRYPLLLLLPALLGFDSSDARRVLDRVFYNMYAPDRLAGVELQILATPNELTLVHFAYGRKTTDDESRTLVFTGGSRAQSRRVLLFQKPGERDRVYLASGRSQRVKPLSRRQVEQEFFSSDFSYEDFRTHRADEYRVESLGTDQIEGEPCRVLRLWPKSGPYRMLVVWISRLRPIIVRTDYFDEQGLWKRYRVALDRVIEDFEWWVPLEDEMLDLRTGSRTVRHFRNILVDVAVPDELFSLARLARGHMPSF